SWFARSKDHGVSDPGTVRAIAIGIQRCLTLVCLGSRCFQANCLQTEAPQAFGGHVDTGYAAAIDIAEQGAATSFGAQAFFDGAGRLLTQITPLLDSARGGMRALSKDHGYVDGGSNGAGAVT